MRNKAQDNNDSFCHGEQKNNIENKKMTNDSSFLNYHFIQNQKNTYPHHPVIKICNVRSDLGTKKKRITLIKMMTGMM